ncbi:hypothetical protein EDC96DRAFT_568389 [Choanephora cucurbitarum]|nr:hypothetical protein EDC96DRAFT_568389 [Choanephora cucurbitarum]
MLCLLRLISRLNQALSSQLHRDMIFPDLFPKHPKAEINSMQFPVCSIQYSISNIQYPISNIQYPISNIQYPISNIQYSTFQVRRVTLFCPLLSILPSKSTVAKAYSATRHLFNLTRVVVGSGLQNRNKTFLYRVSTVILLLFDGL